MHHIASSSLILHHLVSSSLILYHLVSSPLVLYHLTLSPFILHYLASSLFTQLYWSYQSLLITWSVTHIDHLTVPQQMNPDFATYSPLLLDWASSISSYGQFLQRSYYSSVKSVLISSLHYRTFTDMFSQNSCISIGWAFYYIFFLHFDNSFPILFLIQKGVISLF